jgi:predicted RNase H-like HicB family nuclease
MAGIRWPSISPRAPNAKLQRSGEGMTGTIWIDEVDREIARFDGRHQDLSRRGPALRGNSLKVEQSPVGEGIWMPVSMEQDVASPKGLVEIVSAKSTDFRKFDVQSKHFSAEMKRAACMRRGDCRERMMPIEPLQIDIEREWDGRFLASVPELAGVMAYGDTEESAAGRVKTVALQVLSDMFERGDELLQQLKVEHYEGQAWSSALLRIGWTR